MLPFKSTVVLGAATGALAQSCIDSASWHKKSQPGKNCKWVAKFPEKRCQVRGEAKELGVEACPVACGMFKDVDGFGKQIEHISWMAQPEMPLADHVKELKPVGSHTELIAEATDALYCSEGYPKCVKDGKSGDTDFPYGDLKVLATVGEMNPKTGHMLVGVPDGMGSYLIDDDTVRFIFQSESYGPINWWCRDVGCADSYPFIVNSATGATFTGSHIMYIDYDRDMLKDFMKSGESAAHMVKDSGNLVKAAYNLHGDLIQPRSTEGNCCSSAPHFSTTDKDGCGCWTDVMAEGLSEPESADWVMMSLCSAHLEEKHQWGEGMGVEDDLFITNEEWTSYKEGAAFTGIPAHVVDLATGNMYATGVFTLGGFEKIVEFNCGHEGYVCFSPSGYNGNFGVSDASRKNAEGLRPDGQPYVWTQYVVPSRIYIGQKGRNAKGEVADDFLSRNGLAYGQVYGFSADESATGGLFMDAFHKEASGYMPGAKVPGAFYPIDWRWSGVVTDFLHDGSWSFQHPTADGRHFWNSAGYDAGGCKTEHNSPDPYGGPRYMQSSTCGYYGIFDVTGVKDLLDSVSDGQFPDKVPAMYTMLEGERDITAQIHLGGKGKKANGEDQTTMSDSYSVAEDGTISDSAKKTFEDIDGFEWIAASDNADGYVIIQEDGGNDFGERTFISKVETDGSLQQYYFIAMSGGDDNTRNKARVGIPVGTNVGYWDASSDHEFSGVTDFTGFINGAEAGVPGSKRAKEAAVHVNEKLIAFGLQAHSLTGGVIEAFHGDRGGQVYAYQPNLP